MSKEKKSLFWASYADLMTSLFFIMLTLFVASSLLLNQQSDDWKGKYNKSISEKEQLERINDAVKDLDSSYFEYVDAYKKSKLIIPVNFKLNQSDIYSLPQATRNQLKAAGKSLQAYVSETSKKYPGVQYILIIEGQASRIGETDHNYILSYERAYGLKKFWEGKGITFDALNCEVLIGGSGDGIQSGTGLMREKKESLNQRFLIHILPKPGYVNNQAQIK